MNTMAKFKKQLFDQKNFYIFFFFWYDTWQYFMHMLNLYCLWKLFNENHTKIQELQSNMFVSLH